MIDLVVKVRLDGCDFTELMIDKEVLIEKENIKAVVTIDPILSLQKIKQRVDRALGEVLKGEKIEGGSIELVDKSKLILPDGFRSVIDGSKVAKVVKTASIYQERYKKCLNRLFDVIGVSEKLDEKIYCLDTRRIAGCISRWDTKEIELLKTHP